MIEPKKRAADMAVVAAGGVKRARTELVAAAQSHNQLVAMVRDGWMDEEANAVSCFRLPNVNIPFYTVSRYLLVI